MPRHRLCLEAIRTDDARESESGVHIEHDREVRHEAASRPEAEVGHALGTQAARDTLICHRGVEIAIGDHDLSRVERGSDHAGRVVAARSGEEKCLGAIIEARVLRIEQDCADGLSGGGAPWLAGTAYPMPAGLEVVRERARLSGLARALTAFEDDEAGSGHDREPTRRSAVP